MAAKFKVGDQVTWLRGSTFALTTVKILARLMPGWYGIEIPLHIRRERSDKCPVAAVAAKRLVPLGDPRLLKLLEIVDEAKLLEETQEKMEDRWIELQDRTRAILKEKPA